MDSQMLAKALDDLDAAERRADTGQEDDSEEGDLKAIEKMEIERLKRQLQRAVEAKAATAFEEQKVQVITFHNSSINHKCHKQTRYFYGKKTDILSWLFIV